LKEIDLPVFDEPKHPRLRQYTRETTKKWSAIVGGSDAFAFVTPEYNFGMPPSLLNALDTVFHEWNYKPVGLVSYGGVSGGLRAQQMIRLMATSFKMMPMLEAVILPFFTQSIEDGVFKSNEAHDKAAVTMLDELLRWTDALKV